MSLSTNKISIILMFLSSCLSFSAEYYVSPNGNDNNNGSRRNPVETIKRAQELANSGDTVYIRGGRYTMKQSQIHQYTTTLLNN